MWYNKEKSRNEMKNMLVSEVEPIGNIGINLLQKENPKDIIDKVVELPLRNACKILLEKGIETVMSSANKNNVLLTGEKPTERDDVYGKQWFYPSPTFEEAGKGYSWIMINFDSLSDSNKDLLFSLEEKTGDNGEKIGEKIIWFVHPFTMGNLDYKIRTGQYSYEYLRTCLTEDEIPKDIEIDERLSKFEKRHVILSYNDRYPTNTVVIRMPIKETTTVEEVDEYFTNFAKCFKNQQELEQAQKDSKDKQNQGNKQNEIEENTR